MADFRELKVWQAAHQLALDAHRASIALPGRDRFELGAHIRRTAISIVSNIAEGNGRHGDREFARFLRIALGSAHELESQILIAKDLESFDSSTSQSLIDSVAEVRRMLFGLIRRVQSKS